MQKNILIAENTTALHNNTIYRMIADARQATFTREQFAAYLAGEFPGCHIHTGGHHVAVVYKSGWKGGADPRIMFVNADW